MDPTACLLDAQTFIDQTGAYEDAAERLRAYFEWRIKGGFEPSDVGGKSGDQFYCHLLTSLCGCADVMADELEDLRDAQRNEDTNYGNRC